MIRPLVLFCLIFIVMVSVAEAEEITGPARIVDGDTIWIGDTKIRLHGIDAPETKQECYRNGEPWLCGIASTDHLKTFIGENTVTCDDKGMDRYKRMIGKCRVGSLDIGAEMVEKGMALPYWKYGGEYYMQGYREARGQGVGIYSGTFIPPWEWRKGSR
jgi:endonuclease YncB( thermonuclease family)